MYTSLNLLPALKSEVLTVTGEPIRGAGWYGPTNGIHSIAIKVQNFMGRVNVQATIATNPAETDWFNVIPNPLDPTTILPYIQYPQPGYVVVSPQTGETSTYGFTFTANAVWVRATMDKSYFLPSLASQLFIATFGMVEYVLLKYGNAIGESHYARSWQDSIDRNK
jgi:hypothetical protein